MGDLPPYSGPMPTCAKCGNFEARTVYYHETFCAEDEYHERMCRRCGYIWYEAVLGGKA